MLSPLPRRSRWAYSSLCSPSGTSPPRKGCRVGLRIVLFEDCSAFTRVTACTLALSPIRDTLIEGFSHFVTSMTAPIASGWSGCRVGFTPTGKAPPCHGAHPKRTSLPRETRTASGQSCHQWWSRQGQGFCAAAVCRAAFSCARVVSSREMFSWRRWLFSRRRWLVRTRK
jgi:hypothetical protein